MSTPSFIQETKEGIILKISVKPNSKKQTIEIAYERNYILISLKSPPDKGKANKELLKFLSYVLGVSSSCLFLSSGATSRDKTIIIQERSKEEIIDKIINYHNTSQEILS